MHIEQHLKTSIQQAIETLFGLTEQEITLQPTKPEFEGIYTYVFFPLVKQLRKAPAEIGTTIGNYLAENSSMVAKFNVIQGFLNISVRDEAWVEALNNIVSATDFGVLAKKEKSVMVEFSSPNTNKPLHLGHLRNNFLGDSIARIMQANGYEVVKTCLVNDRGIHICKSMLAYQRAGGQDSPESSGLKGDHLAGKYYVAFDKTYKAEMAELVANGMSEDEAKKQAPSMLEAQKMLQRWESGDAETLALWNKMNAWVFAGFNETYQKIGVQFDKTYYESNTYLLGKDVVEEGLEKGVFFKKDNGSTWIDLKTEGLDEKLVLRSDGTSVYITQDLGTTDMKFADFKNDKSVWVVGDEQDYHFKVLFAIMKRLGRDYADGCYHLSYGMVDLPSGKMKSREGTVVDADDLVEEVRAEAQAIAQERGDIATMTETEKQNLYSMVGLGALKYFLLKVSPKSRMVFNPQESVKLQGNTGPYIQYTHARICSILRKAEELGVNLNEAVSAQPLKPIEQELIFLLSQYPVKVAEAGDTYDPAVIAQYTYDLAKQYNTFYNETPILKAENANMLQLRTQLSKQIAQTIQKSMRLLGIDVPNKM